MKKLSMLLIVVVSVIFSEHSAEAQITYQIDDGVSENLLGHGVSGDFLWGNYFDAVAGGTTITGLSVAFGDGGVPVGRAFQVAIYEDLNNDGNPATSLMFLASAAGTVATPGPLGVDTFQVIDIPDTVISGGFFVAAFMDGTNNPFPAKLDQTTSQGRSFFAENNAIGGLNLMNPFGTATLSGLIDNFGFPGNWLVRAVSDDAACLLGDVNMDGMVSLLDVSPFVAVLTSPGSFQCEADTNEDGMVSLLDVSPFVTIITGG